MLRDHKNFVEKPKLGLTILFNSKFDQIITITFKVVNILEWRTEIGRPPWYLNFGASAHLTANHLVLLQRHLAEYELN